MKLAEALKLRKSNNEKLRALLQKISAVAYSTTEDRGETADELVVKYLALIASQEALISRIFQANLNTYVVYGGLKYNLFEAKTRRDILTEASAGLAALPSLRVKKETGRIDNTMAVVEYPIQLDYRHVRHVSDQFARDARELDSLLQSANWTTEIPD